MSRVRPVLLVLLLLFKNKLGVSSKSNIHNAKSCKCKELMVRWILCLIRIVSDSLVLFFIW